MIEVKGVCVGVSSGTQRRRKRRENVQQKSRQHHVLPSFKSVGGSESSACLPHASFRDDSAHSRATVSAKDNKKNIIHPRNTRVFVFVKMTRCKAVAVSCL